MVGPSGSLRPTPAQRRVADPRRSAWVVANAGTGKTRVLTDRVLRLLLDGADPAGILCLTFTRAAAAEMTARIEARLAAWATASDEDLAADLEALLGTPPDGPTERRARRLFARVLELPRGLAIQTIHAFCGELLRRFPLEAGIPPHFETADEGRARELFAEAREEVLAEAAARPESPSGRALARLAAEFSDGSLFEALDELRRLRRPLLAAVEAHGGLDGLLEALAAALGADPDEEETDILAAACAEEAFDREALSSLCAWWEAHRSDRARRAAATLGAWLARDPAARRDTLHELSGDVFRKDWKPNGNLLRLGGFRNSEVAAVYTAEADRWQTVWARVRARSTLARSEALLRIGHAVLLRYDLRMRREALLDFDDLIAHARRLLEGGTAWVLYKLDARIEHVLVDEAQDTSPEQWRIVEAILDEFLAGTGAHDRPRTFFVVGDEKQSIYSFQGADVENFRRVRARLLERARAGGHPLVTETLAESFRGTEAVLGLVDRLFAAVPEVRSGVVAEGEALRHEVRRRGEAGVVELWPLYRPPDRTGDDGPWPLPEPRQSRSPEAVVAEVVARTIRDWIHRGEPLAARGRPVRAGDFLLLVRRRGVIQELVVRALQRHGVPVAGVDRMALDAHLAVMDLVALGRAVLLPEDDYTFACLLKSPLLGLDEDQLFALAHDRGGRSLFARLGDFARRPGAEGEPWRRILERFQRWRARADFVPPYEFYAWVLGAEGGRARLLERLGPDAAEPLEAFLAKALAFEEGHPASLEGFLHWFTLGAGELVRDPGKAPDAVRVTTVHGAKGLEAPVVFLLDAGPHGAPRERCPLLWLEAEGRPPLPVWRGSGRDRPPPVAAAAEAEARRRAEEENRLLYVALTRAADRLVVTGWAGSRTRDDALDRCWHDCIRRALETLEGVEREPVHLAEGFTGEILRWRRGQPRPRAETAARPASSSVELPAWIHRPAAPEPVTAPCAPSGLAAADEDEKTPPAPDDRGRDRGLALHLLLQHLPAVPEARRREVATALLRAEHPELAPELDGLLAEALRVMALPEIAAAFGPGSRAEQPVAGMVDGRPVAGRIDRFAVEDGRVLVVDFKSHPRPPDRVPDGILHQMRHYARILRGLYPDRRIEAAVVWTALPRVDVLDLSGDPSAGPGSPTGSAAADPVDDDAR